MRTMILAAVIGLGSTAAVAGPSDHQSRRFGDYSATERPHLNRLRASRQAPYALTGRAQQRRVIQFRDVPTGRGQTDRRAFWTWVSE